MAANPNDITAYRKKKKKKSLVFKVTAMALTALVTLLVWFNAEAIFEPLRGIGSKISTKTTDEVGFPVKLPGSAGYSIAEFGTNFSLLTDTYLYTYAKSGAQIYALQHGYSNPIQKTTDRRILIYNHGGNEFSLYNKQSRLYENKLDEKIVFAVLDKSDTVAIITASTLYSNILYVYDGNGKWLYTRRFGDEKVNAVAFASGTDEIYVTTSTVSNGDIASFVYRLKYSSKEDLIWKQDLPLNSLSLGLYETDSSIMALCDNNLISLSHGGEILGSYGFNEGTLKKPVIGRDFSVLILSDYVTGTTIAISFDNKVGQISSKEIGGEITKVEISGNMVYTLEGAYINIYDRYLELSEKIELGEEYENFIKIDNQLLFLGYEKVDSKELK